ncbi:MAG: M13 family metallopeptidase [Telluria sp.]
MHMQRPSQYRFARIIAGTLLALVSTACVCAHAADQASKAHSQDRKHRAPVANSNAMVPAANSTIDLSAMDPSVDACDDFYMRSCGGYIATARLSETQPSVAMADQQFEANLERTFETLFSQDVRNDPELARLKTFYTSCLAGTGGDGAIVKEWLARIDDAQSPAQIQALLLQLSSIGVDPFFTYTGQPDRKQSDRYRGEINYSYIWGDEQAILRAFTASGMAEADARRDAAAVASIVAALRKERGDRYDASTAENPRTLAELARLAPSIDWQHYFAMVGAPPGQVVNVTSPGHLRAVEKELATRSPAELRAMLRWAFLFSLRGELPAPYNAAFGDIIPPLRVKLGNPVGRCRDATVRAMGVEFSRQYATRVLGWKARDAALKIATDIKAQIVAAVGNAAWLSPEGRKATADKLSKTDLKIGFPDQWPEVGNYPLKDSTFLANVLAARTFEQRRAWARVGKEHARANWDMIVSPWVGDGMAAARLVVPNGFPDALSNSIIMTAAFLSPPRFDGAAAPELNYATFGSVFAHEFVHVAETHMYGADGRDQELWSDADIKAEEKQGQCVVDQANAYEPLPGVKMKGDHQYGENVADYGGLRLAFEALEARLGTGQLYRVDASGTSPAQRFFYRYAQYRCTAQTDDFLRKSVETDGHAPAAFRVDAPLSNLPGFSRAFNCKPTARMVRPAAQQCRVW